MQVTVYTIHWVPHMPFYSNLVDQHQRDDCVWSHYHPADTDHLSASRWPSHGLFFLHRNIWKCFLWVHCLIVARCLCSDLLVQSRTNRQTHTPTHTHGDQLRNMEITAVAIFCMLMCVECLLFSLTTFSCMTPSPAHTVDITHLTSFLVKGTNMLDSYSNQIIMLINVTVHGLYVVCFSPVITTCKVNQKFCKTKVTLRFIRTIWMDITAPPQSEHAISGYLHVHVTSSTAKSLLAHSATENK